LKRTKIKINGIIKGLVFASRPHVFIGWMRKPLSLISNTLSLTKWIARQERKSILNDFYIIKRDYSRRYKLYDYVSDSLDLQHKVFDYFEFGVAGGNSFRWWVNNSKDKECRFYGFDTFEGLPEDWGTFSKRDMAADVPSVNDDRVTFVKGLFQDTLPDFLRTHNLENGKLKVYFQDTDRTQPIESEEFDTVLVATGRYPDTIKLGCESNPPLLI